MTADIMTEFPGYDGIRTTDRALTTDSALTASGLKTPPGRTEAERVAAEQAIRSERRRRAVRVIAATAQSTAEARMLLDMLGMSNADVQAARASTPRRAA